MSSHMISLFDERITVLFQLIDGGFERNGHGCRSGVDENSGGGGTMMRGINGATIATSYHHLRLQGGQLLDAFS